MKNPFKQAKQDSRPAADVGATPSASIPRELETPATPAVPIRSSGTVGYATRRPDAFEVADHRIIFLLERQSLRHGHTRDRQVMADAAALLRHLYGLAPGDSLLYP